MAAMRIGKLSNEDLERLVLSKFHRTRPESMRAPAIGEDCALLDMGNDYIVLSMDPITAASPEALGKLSVHVNCNDAVCAGAEPVGLLVTLLVPPTFTKEGIEAIADSLHEASAAIHVDILGGHTEVTDAVTRPVTCSAVIARRSRKGTLPGMQEGDEIILTKWAALEGTTLLAATGKYALTDEQKKHCMVLENMLSVVPEGRIALAHGAHSMHDVTEGGVLGAIWEMSYAAGKGICVDTAAIPILPVTKEICRQANIDPLKLIGSGSLLIACPNGESLIQALADASIPAAIIGRCSGNACTDQTGTVLPPPQADALYDAQ